MVAEGDGDAAPLVEAWRDPPGTAVVAWAAGVLGARQVEVVRGLREGGSPWLLRSEGGEAVLRVGEASDAPAFAREAEAIGLASAVGVPTPAILGRDDGRASGTPLLLFDRLPGSSAIPTAPDRRRLNRLGATLARLHAHTRAPSDLLPLRTRPIGDVDFAALRREGDAGGLQRQADDRLEAHEPSDRRVVLVHGDVWHGNTLWGGGTLTGVVDWDSAGVGAPGVDLGSARCDAALSFGVGPGDEILNGWAEVAGEQAPDVAYWDVVAALSTPPDMGWFAPTFWEQGRPDLDRRLLVARRDEFLHDALRRLG